MTLNMNIELIQPGDIKILDTSMYTLQTVLTALADLIGAGIYAIFMRYYAVNYVSTNILFSFRA